MVYVGQRRQSDAASFATNSVNQRVGGTFRSPGPYGSPQSFRFPSGERQSFGSPAGMRSTEPSPRRYATLGSRESGYGVRPAGAVPLDGGVRFVRGALSAERFDALMQQRAQQFRGADLGQSQMAAMEQRYRSQSRGRTGVFASGSPQGVPAAPPNGGPGRTSRFDSYYQQQPIDAGAAPAFEAVERPRSAHSNGRGIPAVQSSGMPLKLSVYM